MDSSVQESQQAIREEVRKLCQAFPDSYWQQVDKKELYPQEFVTMLTTSGYLAALIPEEYGGAGLGITEASIILEEINRAGGNSTACHAQMYTMGTLLRHGSEEQKRRYLPAIAEGKLRLQAFAVTEPNAGSETTRIETRAVRKGDRYIVNGTKIFISRVKQSDLMLLLARTTPYDELKDKTQGISVFLVDLRDIKGKLEVQPLDIMVNHHTNTVFFEDVEVPAANPDWRRRQRGFVTSSTAGMRSGILVAAEAIGDGRWFVERASRYATSRVVFGRPIGANQGIQFPIAKAYAHVEAADMMRFTAAAKYDRKEKVRAEANMAKLLASEASWEAADVCMSTYGGYGFAREYDVERSFEKPV
jgi:acyl-CoA dehydrogenase